MSDEGPAGGERVILVGIHLLVIAGPDKGRTFQLPQVDSLFLGRSRATQTHLIDPHVSRIHCQVQVEGPHVVVQDYDSAGGTFVNGRRITHQPLNPGDVIRIGNTQLQFLAQDPTEPSTLPPGVPATAPPARPPVELVELVGKKLSHYEVGAVLAKGQSSLVFHGRDTRSNLPVALKVLGPMFSSNDQQRRRFVRAMKTVLPLRHPNLVVLHAAGKTGAYCWMAMEYIEGESLTQVVQRAGTAGMLDWRFALGVAIQIGRALQYAHQNQIIHRNVTPMNILIRAREKSAKLGDLMLAKALEGTLAEPITGPGELLGDLHYLSPERTRSRADVDARSDIYSLGATVYALLGGRPPFEGDSPSETIAKIRHAEPVPPTKYQLAIPLLLEGTVLKMLAKRPQDRFQSATDLLTDLERIAKAQGQNV